MVAYAGTGAGSGQVLATTAMNAVSALGSGGSVTIIAGGNTLASGSNLSTPAINITGAIYTNGTTTGGSVTLSNSNATGAVSFTNPAAGLGFNAGGAASASFKAGSSPAASGAGITTDAITTGGGNVIVGSSGDVMLGISTGTISTNAFQPATPTPGSGASGASAGNVTVSGGTITVDGEILAIGANGQNGVASTSAKPAGGAGGAGGNGGAIVITAATAITLNNSSSFSIDSQGGDGGNGADGFSPSTSGSAGSGGAGGSRRQRRGSDIYYHELAVFDGHHFQWNERPLPGWTGRSWRRRWHWSQPPDRRRRCRRCRGQERQWRLRRCCDARYDRQWHYHAASGLGRICWR